MQERFSVVTVNQVMLLRGRNNRLRKRLRELRFYSCQKDTRSKELVVLISRIPVLIITNFDLQLHYLIKQADHENQEND